MNIQIRINPPVSNEQLVDLFADAWKSEKDECSDFASVLEHALFYVGGYLDGRLIGFAKVIWDGGGHGFLLDPTVSSSFRRNGFGKQIVLACVKESAERGICWLHVDFEPHLAAFYRSCGFRSTDAGLINLQQGIPNQSAQVIP